MLIQRVRVLMLSVLWLPVLLLPALFAAGLSWPAATARAADARTAVVYTLSFPAPHQRWMQIDVAFPRVTGTLPLRMSRSSPGRYSLHEFAKNVYDVSAVAGDGRALPIVRVAPHAWDVTGDGGPVHVRYRIFGDRVDGTYLAVDETHGHINAPAALMWAEGRELEPITVRVEPPEGRGWAVATQLLRTSDPFVFSAPNLHYLLDSPLEVSAHERHTFVAESPAGSDAPGPTIVLALHHTGGRAGTAAFVDALRLIVREHAAVFGEYPAFDDQTYTFIADYLPWAIGDGMEHRNSGVLTHGRSIETDAASLLATASHEFFHAWNIERIRPRSLEPFDFTDFNASGELWLGEGFTSYYETLAMVRSGVTSLHEGLATFGDLVSQVLTSPALRYRSADEMSRMALLWDRAARSDRTNLNETFLSYYTHGAALALGFDLALRERSGGRRSLDDFMRAMWQAHGRLAARVSGLVDRPYTLEDVRRCLGEVSDAGFAQNLLGRFVLGRETMEYERLVSLAGLRLRPVAPGRATLGPLAFEHTGGRVQIAQPVPHGSPAEAAGLAQDDAVLMLGTRAIRHSSDLDRALAAHRPGDEVTLQVQRRSEQRPRHARVRLGERAGFELVTVESTGGVLAGHERAFRDAWLGSRFR